ncbi:hypothetical protein [Acinetobacter baumannii]|nr:hypothetical protein [Acinetobacter baumannii]
MKLTKQQRAELKQKFGGHCAYCGDLLGDNTQRCAAVKVCQFLEIFLS